MALWKKSLNKNPPFDDSTWERAERDFDFTSRAEPTTGNGARGAVGDVFPHVARPWESLDAVAASASCARAAGARQDVGPLADAAFSFSHFCFSATSVTL